MKTKEIVEYKNIRLKLKENLKDEKVYCDFLDVGKHITLELKKDRLLNVYDIYMGNIHRGVLLEGKREINVFRKEPIYESINYDESVVMSDYGIGIGRNLEGIYRYMNNWKLRDVSVYTLAENMNENEEKKAMFERMSSQFYLLTKIKRMAVENWLERLLNYGIKEGHSLNYKTELLGVVVSRSYNTTFTEGVIKGAIGQSDLFKKKEKLKAIEDGKIRLNHNDTLDFFEAIDRGRLFTGKTNFKAKELLSGERKYEQPYEIGDNGILSKQIATGIAMESKKDVMKKYYQ